MRKMKSRRWQANNLLIITFLVIFWPIGFYLLWRRSEWNNHTKVVVTATVSLLFVALMVLAVIFAPPTIAITSSLQPQIGANYTLTGTVESADTVVVNGKAVTVANGSFSINIALGKGDNGIDIVAHRGNEETDTRVTIHRYTDAEIARQRQQEAGNNAASKISAAAPVKTNPSPQSTPPKTNTAPTPTPPNSQATTPSTTLIFSGSVTGSATGSINVKPAATATSFDSVNASSWTTQCVVSGGETSAWSANMTFKLGNNTWEIQISNGNNFGNPSAGKHAAVDQQNNRTNTGALLVYVASQQSIADNQFASDTNLYSYVTSVQDGGTASVTIDSGLSSGTLDLWEVPFDSYSSQNFHITGTWNCAK